MKVFSKEKYISIKGESTYKFNKEWVDYCDGKIVNGGWVGWYRIKEEWCVDLHGPMYEPAPKYRIFIESDGKETTARMKVNGKKVKETVAKLHPVDVFSWRKGAEIAFGRLWEKKDEGGQSEPSKTSVKEIKNALKAAKDICCGTECKRCPLAVRGACFANLTTLKFDQEGFSMTNKPKNWDTEWEGDENGDNA